MVIYMLKDIFYNIILDGFDVPAEQSENSEVDEDIQMAIIDKVLKYQKPMRKILSLRKIRNEYTFLLEKERDSDLKSEYSSMIKSIDKLIKKIEKFSVTDYEDFSTRLFNFLEDKKNKYAYHNSIALLLLSYEGVKEKDLINVCLKDFYINTDKRTPEYIVDVRGIPIPIHKKTYDYITEMAKTYELTYTTDAGGKRQIYYYYSYTRNKHLSVWKTRSSDCELTDEKFFSLRKCCQKYLSEIGMSVTTAYRYGRYEEIFRLEICYGNPDIVDKSTTLIEYAIKNFFEIEDGSVFSHKKEYVEWKKRRLESC